MTKYIIAYDIPQNNKQDYKSLYNYFEKIDALQMQESVYTFKSNKNEKELLKIFKGLIKKEDRLIIMRIISCAYTNLIHNPQELN